MTNIAIFASGSGTNAQKIIEYFQSSDKIRVSLLLSNNKNAFALQRAEKLGVPTKVFDRKQFYESDDVVNELLEKDINWVILAGFLWLIPVRLITSFPDRIINIHPALLPNYGGKGMYGMNVHKAVVDAKEKETGISIHLVNEHYDEGTIIFQAKCVIEEGDTPEMVAEKVHALEHKHFPQVIEEVIVKSKN